MAKRSPTKAHASRAGRDMHNKSAVTRREAGEVLSLMARKAASPKSKKR